jgi:hypothetical protein
MLAAIYFRILYLIALYVKASILKYIKLVSLVLFCGYEVLCFALREVHALSINRGCLRTNVRRDYSALKRKNVGRENHAEGTIYVTGRRRRKLRQLLIDFKEKRRYWKRKYWIALFGELALEEAVDVSQHRQRNERRKQHN